MEKKSKEDREKLINLWMESLVMLDENNDFTSEDRDLSKSFAKFKSLYRPPKISEL